MTSAKKLTIASVAQLLKRRKLLDDQQLETILQQGEQQTARLIKQLSGGRNRKRLPHEEQLSPAEVISSFNLEIPGSKKLLTEDIITEVLARAIGLPYLKIDPLKLDLDIVTSHISRAFALRNLMIPVDMVNGKLVIAVSDPADNQGIEELQRTRRIEVDRVLASRTDILKVLGEFFGFRASVIAAESEAKKNTDITNLEQHFQMRKGLADEEDGVQIMKPMPELDVLLKRAVENGIFGTKMRSTINKASASGIAKVVEQQFEVGKQIIGHGLVPIIEPEVNINAGDKAECEDILKTEILKQLNALNDDQLVMLKLTLPESANFYKELIEHKNVVRVVALSGGYSLEESCKRLSQNDGMIASFSRALSNGLNAKQSDEEFNAALEEAIDLINNASNAGEQSKAA